MKVNGEAIYGTGPTIFGAEAGAFSATQTNRQKGNRPVISRRATGAAPPSPAKQHPHLQVAGGHIELPGVKGKFTKARPWPTAGISR